MPLVIPAPPVVPSTPNRELEHQRRNTKAFIDADPLTLELIRKPRIDTADGGWKFGEPTTVPPQVLRLIPQSDVMPLVQTPDGVQLTPSYVLLGEWTADIQRWDAFAVGGVKFMIVSPIRPDVRIKPNAYEQKADVARL